MNVGFIFKLGDMDIKGSFYTDSENAERFKNAQNKEEILKEVILKNLKFVNYSIK